MDQDFIVTGLLSELKAENIRKDVVIRGLIKVICGVVAAVLVIVAGFLLRRCAGSCLPVLLDFHDQCSQHWC